VRRSRGDAANADNKGWKNRCRGPAATRLTSACFTINERRGPARPAPDGQVLLAVSRSDERDEQPTIREVVDVLVLRHSRAGCERGSRTGEVAAGSAGRIEGVEVTGAPAGMRVVGVRGRDGAGDALVRIGRVVDARQLAEVARVRRRRPRVGAAGVVPVVHAGVERGAGLGLVVEPEGVPDLLADHVLLLGTVVVLVRPTARAAEVVVVQLDDSLRDVAAAAVDPDLSEAEPAGVTVVVVADLDFSEHRRTRAPIGVITPTDARAQDGGRTSRGIPRVRRIPEHG